MDKRFSLRMAATAAASAAVWAFAAASASAADLPSKKSAPPAYFSPAPVASWTGFYVGVNAGGTFGGSGSVNPSAGTTYHADSWRPEAVLSATLASRPFGSANSGFLGGGQIGYNHQLYSSFVLGLEADMQGVAAGSARARSAGFGTPVGYSGERVRSISSASRSLDFLGTVRGRLGYLVTPTLLAYATGGLAYGGVNSSLAILQAITHGPSVPQVEVYSAGGSVSDTRVGWTVGGGAEWMFLPNWSAKIEYMYYDLGKASYALSPVVVVDDHDNHLFNNAVAASPRFDGHVVRAGLNYHFDLFGASAPVVANH